jgi:fatty-acyl-CoA synthase
VTTHVLSAAQRRDAIGKRHPTWVPRTLAGALDAACADFADRPFVVTEAGTWTYAQMRDWSNRLAGGLAGLGVDPGDHVAVVLANYAEFVAVRYAIARLGAVTVPINVANRTAELGFIVARSDASVLITMDHFRGLDYLAMLDDLGEDAFPALRHVVVHETGHGEPRPGVRTLADLAAAEPVTEPAGDPDDVADVLFTSGTTGEPKGVQLTHDMLLRTAYGSTWGRAYTDAHRVVFSLPLFHVYGYVEGLLTVPFVGGAVITRLTFDADTILDTIEAHRADDALMIPTMTAELIRAQRATPRDLSSLTHLYSSGGVSPHGIWPEIDEVLSPGEVVTGYGMSETTASTTCTWPEDPPERRMTTNGRMKRAGVAGDPELDGRLSYRCGGEQVVPGDVETVLSRHPSVHQAFVVPVPDARRGEVGWAWIVPREGQTVDAEVLVAWCTEFLARFKVPRHIAEIAVADVPLTASGRARKFLLAERATSALAERA